MKVSLGVQNGITMDDSSHKIYRVVKAMVNPKHVDHEYYHENDIALLKLHQEIEFDDIIRPVCLPYKGTVTFISIILIH